MGILQQNMSEELTAWAEDYFVHTNLMIIHSIQGNISKVLVIPQWLKSCQSKSVKYL